MKPIIFSVPLNHTYVKITPGNFDEDEKYAGNWVSKSDGSEMDLIYYSLYVKENFTHYIKAKIGRHSYFSPGYDAGYIRAKPNRFYHTNGSYNSIYLFETDADVIIRTPLTETAIKKLEQGWIYEDLSLNSSDPTPAFLAETGTYSLKANMGRINAFVPRKG